MGTYTQPIHFGTGEVLLGKGGGIYCIALDHDTGAARVVHVNPSVPNPSFLCCSGQGFLWAVSELKEYEGMASGAVSSFRIDRDSLALERINTVPTMGEDPCYVSVAPESGLLFAANYSSGSLSAFPVNGDGSLEPIRQLIIRSGSGPDAGRQEASHVHCAVPVPGMGRIMVCDLGTDRICEYPIPPKPPGCSRTRRGKLPLPRGAVPDIRRFPPDLTFVTCPLSLPPGFWPCGGRALAGRRFRLWIPTTNPRPKAVMQTISARISTSRRTADSSTAPTAGGLPLRIRRSPGRNLKPQGRFPGQRADAQKLLY